MHKNTFYKPTANVLMKVSSIKYEVCNMWSFFVCFVEVNQAIKRLLTSFLLDKCVIKMSTNVSGKKQQRRHRFTNSLWSPPSGEPLKFRKKIKMLWYNEASLTEFPMTFVDWYTLRITDLKQMICKCFKASRSSISKASITRTFHLCLVMSNKNLFKSCIISEPPHARARQHGRLLLLLSPVVYCVCRVWFICKPMARVTVATLWTNWLVKYTQKSKYTSGFSHN